MISIQIFPLGTKNFHSICATVSSPLNRLIISFSNLQLSSLVLSFSIPRTLIPSLSLSLPTTISSRLVYSRERVLDKQEWIQRETGSFQMNSLPRSFLKKKKKKQKKETEPLWHVDSLKCRELITVTLNFIKKKKEKRTSRQ